MKMSLRAGIVCVSLLAAGIATADVKIVSQVHSTVMGNARPDMSVTTYYRGDLMRTDVNGLSTVFDAKRGKVFVMNNDKKTYADLSDEGEIKGMKIDASATVTPTDYHKSIAGYNTTKYIAKIHMTMTQGSMNQDMDMEMDVWASSDLKSPFVPAHLIRSVGQLLKGMDVSGLQSFANEMSKIKGYPLEQTLVMERMANLPQGMGGSGPMLKFDSAAQTVDESTLPEALFVVPASFKKVKPSEMRASATGR